MRLLTHAVTAPLTTVSRLPVMSAAEGADLVATGTDMDAESIHQFFATGMLLNVMAAIGATDDLGPWAASLRVC